MTTPDTLIAFISFHTSLRSLEELKVAPSPLPWGLAQKYAQLVISDDVIARLYDIETDPFWWGYASVMQEFKALFATLPKQPFTMKKRARTVLGEAQCP